MSVGLKNQYQVVSFCGVAWYKILDSDPCLANKMRYDCFYLSRSSQAEQIYSYQGEALKFPTAF